MGHKSVKRPEKAKVESEGRETWLAHQGGSWKKKRRRKKEPQHPMLQPSQLWSDAKCTKWILRGSSTTCSVFQR